MIKIKFNIGHGEIRNCWTFVIPKLNGEYAIFFDDLQSYDLCCKFDVKQ